MQVARIDHVHVEVSDRDTAADWFDAVLGLKRHADLAHWADDPMGPLILCAGDGAPALSLFARPGKPVSRASTLAFRTTATGFLRFVADAGALNVTSDGATPLTRGDIVDHDVAWSIYFVDPDQNRFELTTYDYNDVRAALRER